MAVSQYLILPNDATATRCSVRARMAAAQDGIAVGFPVIGLFDRIGVSYKFTGSGNKLLQVFSSNGENVDPAGWIKEGADITADGRTKIEYCKFVRVVIPATGTSTVDVVVSGPGPAGVKYYQSGGTELAVRTADVNTLYPSVGRYETPISTLFEGGAGGPDHLHISAASSDTSVATATVIADTDGILKLIVNVLTTGTSTLTVDAFDALGNTAKYTGNLAIT